MKEAESNPFTLSFGEKPYEYLARPSDGEKLINGITATPPSSRCFLITGVRGSGKTVMLTSIKKEISEREDWLTVELNPGDDMREGLAAKLYTMGHLKHLFLDKEFSVSFHGLTFSLSGKNPVLNVDDLLSSMFAHLKKKGKKVLICVDEVSNSLLMRQFAWSFQILIRQGYDLILLGTGLFENIFKLENEKNLTFLIRSQKTFLSPLPYNSMVASYSKNLGVGKEEAEAFAKTTKGYAFAFQLLGHLLYEEKDKKLSSSLLSQYDAMLSEYSYDKIWSTLSEGDKKVVRAFSSNAPSSTGDILKGSELSKDSFSRYRDRLLKKGVIASLGWGKLMLALPRFKEYVDARLAYEDF